MIHLGFKTSGKFSAGDMEANKTCYNDVGTKGVFACDPGKPARHRQAHDLLSLGPQLLPGRQHPNRP